MQSVLTKEDLSTLKDAIALIQEYQKKEIQLRALHEIGVVKQDRNINGYEGCIYCDVYGNCETLNILNGKYLG